MASMLSKDVLARPAHPRQVEVVIESAAQLIGEEAMVQSAFSNLVDNAAKYNQPNGRVTLSLNQQGKTARLTVANTGPGIPGDQLPRVFDRFFRGDSARRLRADGSGLGLSIARQVVADHGGTIRAENRPGQGAIFTIELPAAQGRSPHAHIANVENPHR